MTDGPRYTTLRDYVRVLRARRLTVLVVIVACVASAYLITSGQAREYESDATIGLRDPGQELDQLGNPGLATQDPGQTAAVYAEFLDDPAVARGVKRRLHSAEPAARLRSRVKTRVENKTSFLVVTARSGTAASAAALAQGFADELSHVITVRQHRRYRRSARVMRRQYKRELRRGISPDTQGAFLDRISRVETLADVTQPARIARPAGVPTSPVAPKPVRNSIVGGLIGLALGILAAFARDALDARLRGSRSIQEQVALPLLGHVGEEPLKLVARGVNGGTAISDSALEPFHILRANMRFMDPERATRSVAITSALPEEGKSTVAMLLAWAYAVAGSRALLVECDFRRPALAARFGVNDAPGLADFLRDAAGSREILREVTLGQPGSVNGHGYAGSSKSGSFSLIPAGRPAAHPAKLLGSAPFGDLVSVLSRAYDIVILDCTPILPVVDTLEVLPHVDAGLLCVRDSSTTGVQLRSAKQAIERVFKGSVGIVVTGSSSEEDYGYYASEEGAPALGPSLPAR